MGVVLLVFLLFTVLPANAEVPFGVKPQQVEVTFTVVPEDGLQVGMGENGEPGPDDNKPNKHWGIKIGEINYHLTFWNVGAEGGTSGWLFWKKNYGDASLTVNWDAESAGFVNGSAEDIKSPLTGETLHNTWHIEPASKIPEFNSREYHLKFSGGPNGTFTEVAPFKHERPVTGRVINGKKVELDPSGAPGELGLPMDSEISPYVQPFFGWDLEFDEENSITAVLLSGSATISQLSSNEATDDWIGSRPVDSGDGIPLVSGKPTLVKVNNQISTGPNTRVLLKFPDGSEFRIKSNTIVQVADGGLVIRVGDTRFSLQKQGKEFNVVTPTTVCGVLGTTFVVHVDQDGKSTVQLVEGQVKTASKQGGTEVVLNAGESISGTNQGLSDKQKFDVAAVEKEWASGWEYNNEAVTGSTARWVLYAGAALVVLLAAGLIIRSRKQGKTSAA